VVPAVVGGAASSYRAPLPLRRRRLSACRQPTNTGKLEAKPARLHAGPVQRPKIGRVRRPASGIPVRTSRRARGQRSVARSRGVAHGDRGCSSRSVSTSEWMRVAIAWAGSGCQVAVRAHERRPNPVGSGSIAASVPSFFEPAHSSLLARFPGTWTSRPRNPPFPERRVRLPRPAEFPMRPDIVVVRGGCQRGSESANS
jgi:hypothetical protein